ncbi:esterase [Novosphingobium profundi]|uniref:alpha/beta hydrolase family esterase n=1 Tax=Novosphingobium profundi TaxID=1774954 RepID=UPI001BD9EE51|nr:PHB depolymerase family esterase [Novosphingobium profundi]MBT0667415.1 esterase [Novosphingobium profundi]
MTSRFRAVFKRVALPLLFAAGLASPANAREHVEHIAFQGRDRTFTVHQPDTAPPPGGFPVILAFHGGGMQGAQMAKLTHLDRTADTHGFIAVYPDGIDKHWNDGRTTIRNPQDDVGFVKALLAKLAAQSAVDPRRIYATGISNGALFAERLGCDLASQISGIAPVAGTLPVDTTPKCHPARPVAVLQIDGTRDPIMPFEGGSVADFGGRGEGGNVLSVTETLAFWRAHNGCGAPVRPETLAMNARFDRTRIVRTRSQGCPRMAPVELLTVVNGGHTWPGGPQYAPRIFVGLASQQIDASAQIAEFFLNLPPA